MRAAKHRDMYRPRSRPLAVCYHAMRRLWLGQTITLFGFSAHLLRDLRLEWDFIDNGTALGFRILPV